MLPGLNGTAARAAGSWVLLRRDLTVFCGPLGSLAPHRQPVPVLLFGTAPFELLAARRSGTSVRRRCAAATVAGGVLHRLEFFGQRTVVVYPEPGHPLWRLLADGRADGVRSADAGLTPDHVSRCAAPDPWDDPGFVDDLARRVGAEGIGPAPGPGPRVRAAVDRLIRVSLETGSTPSVRELAEHVGLSTSRFTHVFTAEIGCSARQYRSWTRLRGLAARLAAGTSLTDAAAAAGFSDSSHLARTFRATFGVAPSHVIGSRVPLVVDVVVDGRGGTHDVRTRPST